jgi:dihydroorotate dehydrogenase
MLHTPYYNPEKSYEENFKNGPFGGFRDGKKFKNTGKPSYDFLGQFVYAPFGIPAGPLLNGNYLKAALDKGFDIVTYKTVRSHRYPCNPWPNVLGVRVKGNLTLKLAEKGVVGSHRYIEPLAVTNSFGVPSFDPDFWQKDMAKASEYAKSGQIVIGSFQGTTNATGDINSYIKDFVRTARLVKETKVKVIEVNLSCPNEGTAHLLCFDMPRTKKIVDAIKNEIGNTPLVIKIAYFPDQGELEKLVHNLGKQVDGISAINTIPAKIFDSEGKQALPGQNRLKSGVCGSPIKWAGLDMVKRLRKLREKNGLTFAIIGVGGVTTPEDYVSYRRSGADAVMSATGSMWNPYLAQKIKQKAL